jgi:homoserine kinase
MFFLISCLLPSIPPPPPPPPLLFFLLFFSLSQPIRGEKAFPHLNPMIAAAIAAGAHGAFLSGAGPTVMAICSGASGDVFAQKSDERQEVHLLWRESISRNPERKKDR